MLDVFTLGSWKAKQIIKCTTSAEIVKKSTFTNVAGIVRQYLQKGEHENKQREKIDEARSYVRLIFVVRVLHTRAYT